jgi:hypothetical protein
MVTIYYAMKLYDGLKLGGLVDDACYPIFREIKKDFGLRSILQDNHGRVSHFTHNSNSNFSFLKECNNLFRSFLLNRENKSKTLKTDQPIGQFNLSGFVDGREFNDSTFARVFYHHRDRSQNSCIAHIFAGFHPFFSSLSSPSLLSPSPTVIDKEDGGLRLYSQPLIVDRRLSGPRIGPDAVRLVDPRFNF